ncbi:alpha/beta fold hydrolase, partial [Nostoc sp. NIES-2111]
MNDRERQMRGLLAALFTAFVIHAAAAAERWQTLPPTPPPVSGATTGYAEVNGIRLYFATIGSGPPVVLLHGGLANSNYWGHQVQALAPAHKVILVDSRGHGRSTAVDKPYSIAMLAEDALAILDQLGIDGAHFCGLSKGGMVGQWLATHHGARLNRVVLANTGARMGPPELWNSRIRAGRRDGMAGLVQPTLGRWLTQAFPVRDTATGAQVRA